ncbi:hypothetical protein NKH77_52095 [Streptomyces sp. M19]
MNERRTFKILKAYRRPLGQRMVDGVANTISSSATAVIVKRPTEGAVSTATSTSSEPTRPSASSIAVTRAA